MTGIKGKVVRDRKADYPEPLLIKAGEILTVEEKNTEWSGWTWCVNNSGQGRWVPDKYLEIKGDRAAALRDYDSTELTVTVGEELTVLDEEADWFWCETKDGRAGWVPVDCVEIKNR